MSGFHYIEFSKTGSILLNAEEKDELFGYLDRLKAENEKLRKLVRDLYEDQCCDGDEWKYRDRMRELGIEADE